MKKSVPASAQRSRVAWIANPFVWLVVLLLAMATAFHYLTPQTRLLSAPAHAFLARHAVERFAFLIPVIVAAGALRWRGGALTLALAITIMLPRAIWISPTRIDALFETGASAAVGGLAIWAIEAQARQRELHQEAAARLSALNAVSLEITSVLDLDEILGTVLRIATELVGADGGGIALYDPNGSSIHYPYLHNMPPELAEIAIPRGQGVSGEVTTTGCPLLVENYPAHPGAMPAFVAAGLTSVVCVPIISGERTFGALTLASLRKDRHFSETDVELLTGIGRQAAIAIENARLYQGMRLYARRVVEIQEEERKRIARDLHDETIQNLIVISRRLDLLVTVLEPLSAEAEQLLRSTHELLHEAQTGIRRFVQGLRPSILDHLGLVPSVRSLANSLGNETGLEVQFEQAGETRRLPSDQELGLYRMTQEALHNVRRHAQATWVRVGLVFSPDHVQVTVQDNGQGFVAPRGPQDLASLGRLGLMGMDERAQSLGGSVHLYSEPGQGTTVTIDLPG